MKGVCTLRSRETKVHQVYGCHEVSLVSELRDVVEPALISTMLAVGLVIPPIGGFPVAEDLGMEFPTELCRTINDGMVVQALTGPAFKDWHNCQSFVEPLRCLAKGRAVEPVHEMSEILGRLLLGKRLADSSIIAFNENGLPQCQRNGARRLPAINIDPVPESFSD